MRDSTKRGQLVDVREVRHAPQFELRADNSDELTLTGYASTFEPYDMYGGPARGGWIEQLDKKAFTRTLRESPDLHLLINHEGAPLARTKSGTLTLSVDRKGLKVSARLDRADPDVQRLESKMKRGDMDEMSFAFRVKNQTWSAAAGFDDPQSYRLITEVSLHKGDVSVVNFGANPTTSAEVLGRKKKGSSSMRKTLSLADAAAVVALDAKKGRSPGGRTLSLAEAEAEVATGRSGARPGRGAGRLAAAQKQQTRDAVLARRLRVRSDEITARAQEILAVSGDTSAPAAGGLGGVLGRALLPPMGGLIAAADKAEARRRHDEQIAELDRQRGLLTDPPRRGWPYGRR